MSSLAVVLGLASVVACKQKQAVDADKTASFRKGERKLDVSGAPAGKNNSADVAPAYDPNASYLLSPTDALKLLPVVEAFRKPTFPNSDGNYTQAYEKYRLFTQTALNRGMGLAPLAPGRVVSVRIADDQSVNSFAGAFQDVTITSGTVNAADSTELLAVLCHELAHSARNHSMKTLDFQGAPGMIDELLAFYAARDAYYKKAYDDAPNYTHDLAGYQPVRALWNKLAPRLGKFTKRQESEADVTGGQICGRMGMPPEVYITALSGFLATGDALDNVGADTPTAEQLAQGDKFQLDRDGLNGFLFPQDSHPSNAERKDQLVRVKKAVAEQYDQRQTLFKEWGQGYKAAAQGLGLAGLSLSDAVQSNVLTVKTESGKVLKIKTKHLCGSVRR